MATTEIKNDDNKQDNIVTINDEDKKEKSSKEYLKEMSTLYNEKYTKQLLNNLKEIEKPNKTHLIIKNLLKPNEVKEFVELAMPLFPKQAKQGLVEDDKEKTKPSPVKWINIRGRDEYMIQNEELHLFLLFRKIYSRCKQHGIKFISNQDNNKETKNKRKHRPPYTFTNLYDKNQEHGLGFHQDDVDLFSVVILLTDDYGEGVLQLKDNENNIYNLEMDAGDGVILSKGVWHQVPIVKRDHDRISINLFF